METNNLIGCWMDGAVPRTNAERCEKLRELLSALINLYAKTHEDIAIDAYRLWGNSFGQIASYELENKLIFKIESLLPESLELILEAGDVIICEKEA